MPQSEPVGYGTASGAFKELDRIGAVEGLHYRRSTAGEVITDFVVAVDNGKMVMTIKGGFEVVSMPGSEGEPFAVLNADGMDLIGVPLTAQQMRDGKIPPEIVYVLAVA